jgi:uncharacterized protein (DUF302 family)
VPWCVAEALIVESAAGIVDVLSRHPVSETLDRLESLVRSRGMLVFARIDFTGDAGRAGLTLRPMQALLFGSPSAGTPLLVASPRAGLDLPLKALAWEDAEGRVWVSLNAPEYLAARHALSDDLVARIAGARALVEQATG